MWHACVIFAPVPVSSVKPAIFDQVWFKTKICTCVDLGYCLQTYELAQFLMLINTELHQGS